jgi:hypothetical protein
MGGRAGAFSLKSDIGVDEAAAAAVASSIKPNDWQRIGGRHAFQLTGKSAKPVGRDRKGEVVKWIRILGPGA